MVVGFIYYEINSFKHRYMSKQGLNMQGCHNRVGRKLHSLDAAKNLSEESSMYSELIDGLIISFTYPADG